jgi:hypothetical protein
MGLWWLISQLVDYDETSNKMMKEKDAKKSAREQRKNQNKIWGYRSVDK